MEYALAQMKYAKEQVTTRLLPKKTKDCKIGSSRGTNVKKIEAGRTFVFTSF